MPPRSRWPSPLPAPSRRRARASTCRPRGCRRCCWASGSSSRHGWLAGVAGASEDPGAAPKWVDAVDDLSPMGGAVVAFSNALTSPKNLALAIAAGIDDTRRDSKLPADIVSVGAALRGGRQRHHRDARRRLPGRGEAGRAHPRALEARTSRRAQPWSWKSGCSSSASGLASRASTTCSPSAQSRGEPSRQRASATLPLRLRRGLERLGEPLAGVDEQARRAGPPAPLPRCRRRCRRAS